MVKILKPSAKLLLALVFWTFASFILAISFSVILSKAPKWSFYLFLQSFSFIMLVALVLNSVYILGFRDSNMVRTGHIKEDVYRGFKIGAAAQIPALLFLIVSVAADLKFATYRIINSGYYWFLTLVGRAAAENSAGIRSLGVLGIAYAFLLLLIVPAISGTVYILGFKNIDLFSKLVYKNHKE